MYQPAVVATNGFSDLALVVAGQDFTSTSRLVFRGAIDREMFYMDIEELIQSRFRVAEPTSVEETPVVAWNGGVDPHAAQVPLSCLGNKASAGITSKVVKEIHWLHKRMGHPSRKVMMTNVKRNSWNGVHPDINATKINNVMQRHPCTACRLAKDNKLARKEGSGVKPTRTGEVLSCDYQGKIAESIRGYNGWYIFKCLYSGFRHSVMVKDKTKESFQEAISHVVDFYNSYGHRVELLRMDAGSTENAADVIAFLLEHSIHVDPAAVDEQNQNPVEREVQTLKKGVSALLIDQYSLGPRWWCYAVESWIACKQYCVATASLPHRSNL